MLPGLSCEAKVLYGLMLDRMGLSMRNRWLDEEDRVYIVFTVEEVGEMMACGTQKAVKLVKELDAENGIGLIEKKRLGLGKPNVIYVKNFMAVNGESTLPGQDTDDEGIGEKLVDRMCGSHNSRAAETIITEFPESQFKNSENHNSGIVKTTIQE